jgi:type II restriction enzyme
MNLQCRTELAAPYKAGSQIARILSEDWCSRELYCPACTSDSISRSKPNTPTIDFVCPECNESFQLKSVRTWNCTKIVDAGYEPMVRAIRSGRAPNLFLLQYASEWSIENVIVIPRMFFTESVIEKRKPLSPSARRAGWVGCNLVISSIPDDGRIEIVSGGSPCSEVTVRREFDRVKGLATIEPSARGWTVDVLSVIRQLRKPDFSLHDLYAMERTLQLKHPRNQNVRPKIRQQLQVLRDLGLLEFRGQGTYRITG